jgi:hypothetical protein
VEIYFFPTEEKGIQHKTLENQTIIEIKKIYTNFWTPHMKIIKVLKFKMLLKIRLNTQNT